MSYRFLIQGKQLAFTSLMEAKHTRDNFQREEMSPGPLQINCSAHGWQDAPWGVCAQCERSYCYQKES